MDIVIFPHPHKAVPNAVRLPIKRLETLLPPETYGFAISRTDGALLYTVQKFKTKYDPQIHTEQWFRDNPFELVMTSKSITSATWRGMGRNDRGESVLCDVTIADVDVDRIWRMDASDAGESIEYLDNYLINRKAGEYPPKYEERKEPTP